MENLIHPTADQVYEMVREKMPKVSLATVYRNLNLLAENKIILKIEGLNGCCHFDYNMEKHHHFICTKCNKVYDISHEITPDLAEIAHENTGLKVESYEITFKGICHNCETKTSIKEIKLWN